MSLCLSTGESLKLSSKAFEVISKQIKAEIVNKHSKVNGDHQIEVWKTKPQEEIKDTEVHNGTNGEEMNGIEGTGEPILSKFVITERYDPATFSKVKEAIKMKLVTYEIQKEVYRHHYFDELSKWQKKIRGYKDYEQSIAKVTTHPKGKEELENRKYLNLKQRVASQIPEPTEKQTRYLRSEIRKPENIDIYATDIWTFKDMQTFINLFFEHHKNWQEIQNKLPEKKPHEIIALYDLLNPLLSLKKFYRKGKQKSSAARKEFLKTVIPKLKEKLLYLLKDLILSYSATQVIVPLGETKFSRRDLINCLLYKKKSS